MTHHIIAIRRTITKSKETIITNVDENVKKLEFLCITGGNVKWYTSVENNRHFSKEMYLFSSVQLLSRVWLFVTPWTAAHQASQSITNSRSLLKLMSIKSVMPSNHVILCRPLLLLPSIFPVSQLFTSGGQSIGVLASTSVLPMNTQDWSPLGWTGWISLQSKGLFKSLIQHHSSQASILRCSAFFIVQLFTSIHDHWKNHSLD